PPAVEVYTFSFGSKAPHRHFAPSGIYCVKRKWREFMSKRAFGILSLTAIAGIVLSGCASSQHEEVLTPTSSSVVTTRHAVTTTTTEPEMITTAPVITTTGPVTTTTTRTVVVSPNPPPPPRSEIVGAPPIAADVWVSGYWDLVGGRWVWLPGHWEARPR